MIVYLCVRGKFPDLQKINWLLSSTPTDRGSDFWIIWLKVKLLHFNLFEDSLQKLCEVYENYLMLWKLSEVYENCFKFMKGVWSPWQLFEVYKSVWSLQNCIKFA